MQRTGRGGTFWGEKQEEKQQTDKTKSSSMFHIRPVKDYCSNTIREKQIVNLKHGLSAEWRRGGQPLESSHWLVGSDSVRAVKSSIRTASQEELHPTPNQNPASPPEIHGRKEKHREKEKNTKTGEILVSEKRKQTTDKSD